MFSHHYKGYLEFTKLGFLDIYLKSHSKLPHPAWNLYQKVVLVKVRLLLACIIRRA
jgi:hypothetical protein